MQKVKRSIRIKMIFLCMLLMLLMAAVLGVLFYRNTRESFINKETESIGSKLSIALINIEQDYLQIQRFCHSISNNQTVSDYLSTPAEEMAKRKNVSAAENSQVGIKMINAYEEINDMLMNYGISAFTAKCMLVSDNHDETIMFGSVHGHVTDKERFIALSDSWQERFPAGITESPFFWSETIALKYTIPIKNAVYSYNGSRKIGDVYIALSDKFLSRQFTSADNLKEQPVIVGIGGRIYVYDGEGFSDGEQYRSIFEANIPTIFTNVKNTGELAEFNGKSFIVASSESSSICFAQAVPQYRFTLIESEVESSLWEYLFIMLAGVVIWYLFLNHIIKKPIQKICAQLQQISKGDFQVQNEIHSQDEFQLISQEIVRMAGNLDTLMKKAVEDEKLKRNYQFQMLQNQINPHFMYNTLNSIRWMGEMNGIPGIVDMTTTFAKLLRQTFRSNSQLVPLREELAFIEDYGVLLSYRYGNAFRIEYDIETEDLYEARVMKFTIQPLVENAVFHGIEPSRSRKTVEIRARRKGEDLLLFVKDDGVGIKAEELERLNRFQEEPGKCSGKSDKMSGIGIHNIHERISVEYGPRYGVHIDSVEGEYTCVTVRMPLIMEEWKEGADV